MKIGENVILNLQNDHSNDDVKDKEQNIDVAKSQLSPAILKGKNSNGVCDKHYGRKAEQIKMSAGTNGVHSLSNTAC